MRYLVTSALPYANGPIHFGHVAGAYLPADIFVRYKRLRREEVIYICGTDEHGTPITVNAEKEGIAPKAYADKWHKVLKDSFDRLDIVFDNFSRTTKPHHYELTQKFFKELDANGYIFDKVEPQLYCSKDRLALIDRKLVGKCYVCGHDPARGDECPKCGTALDAKRLIDPRCKICGTPAEYRDSRNWYVDLPKLRPKLDAYLGEAQTRWKPNVMGEIKKYWDDLRPWGITRDLDWGVPVPLPDAKDKVLYVWFDAPIGYISSTIEWAELQGDKELWKKWWFDHENTRLIHFIGKDNIAFHTVRWPAMLLGQTDPYVTPHDVPANEFYNLEGDKFSTSSGWYIDFDHFCDRYPADTLRWTIARGAPETKDSEFTWKDFQAKVNSELLGNFGNFASRVLKFVKDKLGGKIPEARAPRGEPENEAIRKALVAFDEVGRELDRYGVRAATERLLELGSAGNKLLEQREPWKTIKSDPDRCATTMNTAARILETLAVALHPFCPRTAQSLWAQLGHQDKVEQRSWSLAREQPDPAGRAVGSLEQYLFKRVEDAEVAAEVESLKALAEQRRLAAAPKVKSDMEKKVDDKSKPAAPPAGTPAPAATAPVPAPAAAKAPEGGPKADISFDDFGKLEIKVAKVVTCVPVAGADKLYQLEVEIEGGAKRTVVSGIRPFYQAEELVGREVVYLANLAPKKLRGVMSQGMILAAHSADGGAVLLKPEKATFPGSKVS
jgi:methionyl-tRNA synthetase